jgi:hypothetical protein
MYMFRTDATFSNIFNPGIVEYIYIQCEPLKTGDWQDGSRGRGSTIKHEALSANPSTIKTKKN